jgi:hypothetical protein
VVEHAGADRRVAGVHGGLLTDQQVRVGGSGPASVPLADPTIGARTGRGMTYRPRG